MTMTTRSRARTVAALTEEAGAVEDLHLSSTQQALSNRRQPLASVSQFRSFTARNPTAPLTPRRDAASQSLRGSADPGRHESTSGDHFPYRHDPTPEHCESSRFQWFSPEDGPGDDPDDPGDDNNNNNNNDDEFLDTAEELDPGLAVFHNLAVTVNRLSHSSRRTSNSSSSRAKVREPDTFDGTDPKKLQTFLVQCELCFQDRTKAFHQDRARVTFAQSYLKGMTLEWFEPDLLNSGDPADRPRWMDSWVHFVAELQSTFGPHDPVADAEHQLEHLWMKDSYRVTRYIVDFNRLASQVQDYGDGALHCLFYSGLPDCLKDEIAQVRKPLTKRVESPLSRDRRALLGVQRRDLPYDEEPTYLVHPQALQLRRQHPQVRSGQDWQFPQLHQHLWLVKDDQQPVLVRFQTRLDQQAW